MRRGVASLAVLLVLCLVGVAVYYAGEQGVGPLAAPQECTATAAGHQVTLSTSQAENASIVAAVAARRGLPARAVSIALATAYQESKLENVEYGDSDSLGLFQQRPSQGWGTPTQVMNRFYATNAFYDALVQVPDYQTIDITKAAQEVQRSAYPTAYAAHEQDGRVLASALTGYSTASFSCVVAVPDLRPQRMQADGLTARANAVKAAITTAYGDLPLGGFAPGGVTSGHMAGSAHYEGRAIDAFFRPVDAGNTRRGWALASYLVANAARLHIQHVIFDRRIWTAGEESPQGWRRYTPPDLTGNESAATLAILEHRDHVHVDVWR
ncbi:MAG: hypothetical protein ACR2JU_12540 [Nocardioidaceae bacterium]